MPLDTATVWNSVPLAKTTTTADVYGEWIAGIVRDVLGEGERTQQGMLEEFLDAWRNYGAVSPRILQRLDERLFSHRYFQKVLSDILLSSAIAGRIEDFFLLGLEESRMFPICAEMARYEAIRNILIARIGVLEANGQSLAWVLQRRYFQENTA